MITVSKIIKAAKAEGFDLVGISPVKKFDQKGYYQKYIDQGYYGQMAWLQKNADLRKNPIRVFPQAKSIIALAISYFPGGPAVKNQPNCGVIARYARLPDYHLIIGKKLRTLSNEVDRLAGEKICLSNCVDAAALLEKEIAQQAELGFIGKNTQLITKKFGSYVFLAEIVVSCSLPSSTLKIKNQCGQCSKCLTACPTGALVRPYVIDARKCISYLTIENKGPIPDKLRSKIGLNIFGCDKCQEVCPFNSSIKINYHPFFRPRENLANVSLLEWLKVSEATFNHISKNSPIKRVGHRGFIRNVIIALGNQGDPKSMPVLKIYKQSKDKLLAEHAEWSINKIKKGL